MNKTKKVVIALSTLTIAATMLSGCYSGNSNTTVNSSTETVKQALTQANNKVDSGNVITAEEQSYLDTVQEYLSSMKDDMMKLADLLGRIEDKGTSDWQAEYIVVAAKFLLRDGDINQKIPPTRLDRVHTHLKQAFKAQADAIQLLTDSIAESNADKVTQAQDLFKQSQTYITLAQGEIDLFKDGKQ